MRGVRVALVLFWGLGGVFAAAAETVTSEATGRRPAPTMEASYSSLDFGAFATNVLAPSARSGTLYGDSSFAGFLRFRRGFHLGRAFHFEPSFGVVVPWRGGIDGGLRIITSHLDLSFGIPLFSSLRWRIGPGVQWVFFWPSGEERRLNNGTGTSTFYVPSLPSNVFLTTVDTGLEWRVTPGFSVGVDVILLQILSSANRRASVAMTVGVVL